MLARGRQALIELADFIFELEAPRLRNPRRVAEGHGQVWRPAGASAQELLDVCGAAEVCEAAVLEGAS